MKKIIAVFKTHVDIGFTHLAKEVVAGFGTTMPEAVGKTCAVFDDFKWTMPSWPVQKAVEAADNRRACALIEKGQLLWHGLPFTTHTAFCSEEELIRGLSISKRLSRRFKKPAPIAAKMTDVPGHTWGLVPLLAKAGIKFLHLGCNPACTPPEVPMLFWWQGPDGSRVLTFYNKGAYGSSLLPPPDWKFPVWLAMQQTNDNLGPQNPQMIEHMVREAAGYELFLGTLDEFYRELEPYLDDSIPTIRADLADTWIHGVGTYPAEVAHLRTLRYALQKAEAKNALAGDVQKQEQFDSIYENCLLFGEHTWGLDVKTVLGYGRHYDAAGFAEDAKTPAYQRMEESWAEQRARVNVALPAEVGRDFGKSALLDNGQLQVALTEAGIQIVDVQSGTRFTAPGFGKFQYDLFSNQDITAFIRAYSYRFFDWSINDLGRMGYPEIEHQTYQPSFAEIVGNVAKAEDISNISGLEIRAGVQEGAPYVDLTYSLDKKKTPLVESGNIVLPFLLKSNFNVEYSCMASVVDIKADIQKNANHGLHCAHKWIRIHDDEKGVLIIPIDAPLFSVGRNMVYQFAPEAYEAAPVIYLNVFNNAWGTNFPQWMGGRYQFRVRLCPYVGAMRDETAYAIADETFSDFGLGDLIETDSDLELLAFKMAEDRKGVVLRVKSTAGQRQTVSMTPKFQYRSCFYAAITEEPLAALEGEIRFESAPYEIHTLYFER